MSLTTSSSHISKQRILVVDDEEELRELLSLKLKKSGFEVDVAANGSEATHLLKSSSYTAVLCDLNLPDSPKGTDLFVLSQSHQMTSVFIAITGYTQDSPEVKSARSAGVKYIFSKPLRMQSILELIPRSA